MNTDSTDPLKDLIIPKLQSICGNSGCSNQVYLGDRTWLHNRGALGHSAERPIGPAANCTKPGCFRFIQWDPQMNRLIHIVPHNANHKAEYVVDMTEKSDSHDWEEVGHMSDEGVDFTTLGAESKSAFLAGMEFKTLPRIILHTEDLGPYFEGNTHDAVDHPSHYTSDPSGVECITVARHRNFNVGNAIKYLWRAGLKVEEGQDALTKQIEDLEKARWYLKDEIDRLKGTYDWDIDNNKPMEVTEESVALQEAYQQALKDIKDYEGDTNE